MNAFLLSDVARAAAPRPVFLLVQSLPLQAASSVRAVVELVLEAISKRVGGQTWLHPMHLELESGAVTVLLGPRRPARPA